MLCIVICYILLDHAPPFIIVKSIALLDHAPPFIIVKVIRNTEVLLPNFLWWPFLSESHIPCLAFISSLPRRAQARFIPKPWCKVGAKSKATASLGPWILDPMHRSLKACTQIFDCTYWTRQRFHVLVLPTAIWQNHGHFVGSSNCSQLRSH